MSVLNLLQLQLHVEIKEFFSLHLNWNLKLWHLFNILSFDMTWVISFSSESFEISYYYVHFFFYPLAWTTHRWIVRTGSFVLHLRHYWPATLLQLRLRMLCNIVMLRRHISILLWWCNIMLRATRREQHEPFINNSSFCLLPTWWLLLAVLPLLLLLLSRGWLLLLLRGWRSVLRVWRMLQVARDDRDAATVAGSGDHRGICLHAYVYAHLYNAGKTIMGWGTGE